MAPITIIPKACSCCKGERSSRDKSSNFPLPNILYEGSKGSKGAVAAAPQVLKKRGAADAAGCVEGLRRFRSGGNSACGAEGCGIAPWAMSMKSALRDLLSVPYGIVSILVISRCAAPPYPATPDFLHGKACHTILRSLCSLTNRVPLPPHPGDRTTCA